MCTFVYIFQNAVGKFQIEIYKKKIAPAGNPENFMNLTTGTHRLRSEFFAYHGELSSLYTQIGETYLESEKCGLIAIDFWNLLPPRVPIRKNSPYKELIKTG